MACRAAVDDQSKPQHPRFTQADVDLVRNSPPYDHLGAVMRNLAARESGAWGMQQFGERAWLQMQRGREAS